MAYLTVESTDATKGPYSLAKLFAAALRAGVTLTPAGAPLLFLWIAVGLPLLLACAIALPGRRDLAATQVPVPPKTALTVQAQTPPMTVTFSAVSKTGAEKVIAVCTHYDPNTDQFSGCTIRNGYSLDEFVTAIMHELKEDLKRQTDGKK